MLRKTVQDAFFRVEPKGSDMLKTIKRRDIVRSSVQSHDHSGDVMSKCIYKDAYTLEPPLVEEAWDTLTEDTFALEIASYPKVIHRAFIRQMKKRLKHA